MMGSKLRVLALQTMMKQIVCKKLYVNLKNNLVCLVEATPESLGATKQFETLKTTEHKVVFLKAKGLTRGTEISVIYK